MRRERRPTHPGELLKDELHSAGISLTDLASRLAVSRRTISQIVNERRPVTPDMAIRLSRAFNTTPELWLNMQAAVDIWDAEQEHGDAYHRIRPAVA
jgi:addiction module HigA family antidote